MFSNTTEDSRTYLLAGTTKLESCSPWIKIQSADHKNQVLMANEKNNYNQLIEKQLRTLSESQTKLWILDLCFNILPILTKNSTLFHMWNVYRIVTFPYMKCVNHMWNVLVENFTHEILVFKSCILHMTWNIHIWNFYFTYGIETIHIWNIIFIRKLASEIFVKVSRYHVFLKMQLTPDNSNPQ